MNIETVKAVMVTVPKGANVVIEWTRAGKVRKGVTDVIQKAVRMVGRLGLAYDNLGVVIEKRENGELPSENAGLQWGVWACYPYLIAHKGQMYLRLYKGTCAITTPKVAWYKNGVEVSKDDIAPLLLKSELDHSEGDCFVVKTEDVTRLHLEIIPIIQQGKDIAEVPATVTVPAETV